MYSFSKLFVNENHKSCNYFIASAVMLYPFANLYTAGWIATKTTYFMPTAFGFFSMIPIKKILIKEKFKWWESTVYKGLHRVTV